MAWGRSYWLACDDEDCGDTFERVGVRLKELERLARAAGWAVGRSAYCPKHRRQEKVA